MYYKITDIHPTRKITAFIFNDSCLHGENSSCIHCLPLEPYDASYLKELNVKHMSFHAYLRKLSSGLDGGKYANLDNISCRIKPGCTGHPPWPKGVCSKCQPKAITLNSQVIFHLPLQHVNHINLCFKSYRLTDTLITLSLKIQT